MHVFDFMSKVDTIPETRNSTNIKTKFYINAIAISVFALLVFSSLSYLFSQVYSFKLSEDTIKYPIVADNIIIESVFHKWRETNSEDKVKSGTLYIPEVTFNFSEDFKGELVAFFENQNSNTVGNGKTILIEDLVLKEGKRTFTYYCSEGFDDLAHYRGYCYSSAPFWSILIKNTIDNSIIVKIPLPSHP